MTVEPAHRYVVASLHKWNETVYDSVLRHLPGHWDNVSTRENLEIFLTLPKTPRYVFFPHWAYKVPDRITNRFECIAFHMTDLPYGRGGSPLQNLIGRGHTSTKLSAFKMTGELDAGPVYLKKYLSLHGSALQIFHRMASLTGEMIKEIIESDIVPVEQIGTPTFFRRRKPTESKLPDDLDQRGIYDFVRMLDAPGYPKAFIEHGQLRIELSNAEMVEEQVQAKIRVKPGKESA